MKKTVFTIVAICALTATAKAQNYQYHCFPDGHCGLVEKTNKTFGTQLQGTEKTVSLMYIAGDMTDAKIIVKDQKSGKSDNFKMTEIGADGRFTGTHQISLQTGEKVEESVTISPVAAQPEFLTDPVGAARKAGLSNAEEVKCSDGDSLIVIINDRTLAPVGNCMTPSDK